MTTVAQSPSPNKTYKIVAVTTQRYGAQYESIIEYADGHERVVERMRDWAGWHGAIGRLSQDGLFFDKVDDGGNVVAFRVEVVEAEPEAGAEATADAVEIDGRAYRVTDRLGVEQLPARVAALTQAAMAADKLAAAKHELERSRAQALASGQIEAKNETTREALLRELLVEKHEALAQAELKMREKRYQADIAQLEVDRIRLRVRLMELAAGQGGAR